MKAILTPEEIHAIETKAIAEGHASVSQLMDLVGKRVYERAKQYAQTLFQSPPIILLIGKGNNGADGYTAGALLLKDGFQVYACPIETHPTPPSDQEPPPLITRREQFFALGGKEIDLENLYLSFYENEPLIIIDAIYGIGMRGVPSLKARKAIEWANSTLWPKIAIDIPSGLNPLTGEVIVNAFQADVTVTCQFPKRGFFFNQGWNYVGEIDCVELGLHAPLGQLKLIEEADIIQRLPAYIAQQDKFSRGGCIAIGGSPGLTGAVSLALQAALSIGLGYIQTIVRKDMTPELPILPIEAVKRLLPTDTEQYNAFFTEFLQRTNSLIIGPGMGRDAISKDVFSSLWNMELRPRVIDADGLYWLSYEEIMPNSLCQAVLTPHHGEARRLIHKKAPNSHQDVIPVETMLENMKRLFLDGSPGSALILKGAPSFLIQGGDDSVYVLAGGDPGMATLGSGDVLSGIIGGLLAQSLSPFDAALVGAWIHAASGKKAAKKYTSYAVTASKIIQAIPEALREILEHATYGTFRDYMPPRWAKPSGIENDL